MEGIGSDKHSSLLQYGINQWRKIFHSTVLRSLIKNYIAIISYAKKYAGCLWRFANKSD